MSASSRNIIAAPMMAALVLATSVRHAPATTGGGTGAADTSLALKLRNPLADLVTVPIETYFEFGSGSRNARSYSLYVQPVIPLELTDDWILVTRTIVPFIHQEAAAAGERDLTGIGDITQSFFLSPSRLARGWIVGAGPVFLYPSATDSDLGTERWGAGPTAAAIRQAGGWTVGALANHIWSFAGDSHREGVSTTLVEPFVSYTWANDFTVEFDSESTFDWKQDQWTVPLTAGVSQLVNLGRQSVNFGLDGLWYAEHEADGAEWGVVLTVTIVIPR